MKKLSLVLFLFLLPIFSLGQTTVKYRAVYVDTLRSNVDSIRIRSRFRAYNQVRFDSTVNFYSFIKYQNTYTDTLPSQNGTFLMTLDSVRNRTFSDLKYLKNADSTSFRTFSDLKYLKNADSTTLKFTLASKDSSVSSITTSPTSFISIAGNGGYAKKITFDTSKTVNANADGVSSGTKYWTGQNTFVDSLYLGTASSRYGTLKFHDGGSVYNASIKVNPSAGLSSNVLQYLPNQSGVFLMNGDTTLNRSFSDIKYPILANSNTFTGVNTFTRIIHADSVIADNGNVVVNDSAKFNGKVSIAFDSTLISGNAFSIGQNPSYSGIQFVNASSPTEKINMEMYVGGSKNIQLSANAVSYINNTSGFAIGATTSNTSLFTLKNTNAKASASEWYNSRNLLLDKFDSTGALFVTRGLSPNSTALASASTALFFSDNPGTLAMAGFFAADATVGGAVLNGFKSRGTNASPSASLVGDNLFQLAGYGYDGSIYKFAGSIQFRRETGAGSTDRIAGNIRFATSVGGADNNIYERMRLTAIGNLAIGDTNSLTAKILIKNNATNPYISTSYNSRGTLMRANDSVGGVLGTAFLADTGSFTTTGVRTAKYIQGAKSTDVYQVTWRVITGDESTIPTGIPYVMAKTDSAIIFRSDGTTSAQKYNLFRIRRE